jgi:hypothetical protein
VLTSRKFFQLEVEFFRLTDLTAGNIDSDAPCMFPQVREAKRLAVLIDNRCCTGTPIAKIVRAPFEPLNASVRTSFTPL